MLFTCAVRIWVDFTETEHVIVLRPLVERLEAAGHDVALTARPLSHTVELLEEWGHPHRVVGRHGGVRRRDKAPRPATACARLLARARGQRSPRARPRLDRPPGRLAAAADPEQHDVRLRVGRRPAPRQLPAGEPRARPRRDPARAAHAVRRRGSKLIRYPGLKEEYDLSDFEPDRGVLARSASRPEDLAVVRTAPSYALYLGGWETPLLARCCDAPPRRARADGRPRAHHQQRADVRAWASSASSCPSGRSRAAASSRSPTSSCRPAAR